MVAAALVSQLTKIISSQAACFGSEGSEPYTMDILLPVQEVSRNIRVEPPERAGHAFTYFSYALELPSYSTVTLFARFLGLSTSVPLATAV